MTERKHSALPAKNIECGREQNGNQHLDRRIEQRMREHDGNTNSAIRTSGKRSDFTSLSPSRP